MPLSTRFENLRSAIRKIRLQGKDPEAVAPAVQSFDALSLALGRGDATMLARMRATTLGRRLLDERHDALALVADRDRLRAMPEGSLGRTYCAFAEDNGLYPEHLAEEVRVARAETEGFVPDASPEVAYLHDRFRDLHDLWHVVTGYGTDMAGELAIVNFQAVQVGYRAMTISSWLQLIGIALRTGRFDVLVTGFRGRRRGRGADYLLAADWERLLPLPLEEVRRELGVPPLRPYRPWDHRTPKAAEAHA
ncbi:MAG: Coq4 family protein [bacterium]|nr:Coq4 family protein [bacterium]